MLLYRGFKDTPHSIGPTQNPLVSPDHTEDCLCAAGFLLALDPTKMIKLMV